MPTLFAFGFAAESKLVHRMEEVAQETVHAHKSVEWAERHHQATKENKVLAIETERQLTNLYRQSVEESGVRIVPGDRLSLHHRVANYWQENPFKILAMMGVPAVGYIFYGRTGKQHLQLQMQVMHTRVMGQFTVISMLLTLMGFKEYMDRNGKFITEREANARVEEMQRVRASLMERLARDKQKKEAIDEAIHKAHDQDVKEGHVMKSHKKKQHEHSKHVEEGHVEEAKITAVSPK